MPETARIPISTTQEAEIVRCVTYGYALVLQALADLPRPEEPILEALHLRECKVPDLPFKCIAPLARVGPHVARAEALRVGRRVLALEARPVVHPVEELPAVVYAHGPFAREGGPEVRD